MYLTAFMPDQDESATSLNQRQLSELGTVLQFNDAGDSVLVGHEIDELVLQTHRRTLRQRRLRLAATPGEADIHRRTTSCVLAQRAVDLRDLSGRCASSTPTCNDNWRAGQCTSSSGTRATLPCCRGQTSSSTCSTSWLAEYRLPARACSRLGTVG